MTSERQLRKMRLAREDAMRAGRIERRNQLFAQTSHTTCHCNLDPTMTLTELMRLGAGCTDPYFVCPRLHRIRNALRGV